MSENYKPMSFASAIGIGRNPEPYQPHEVNEAIRVLAEKLLSVGIKEDMPVFVLKPTDKNSISALIDWINSGANVVHPDKYLSALHKYDEFTEWQKANPSRVKEPD